MKQNRILTSLSVIAFLGSVSAANAVQINEIRVDEPGSDVNEYFELQGEPGESLDGLTYLVIGDHSNFGNPDDDAPFYASGTIEFAFDLTGFSIPDDGFFLIAESGITLVDVADVDFTVSDLIFENNENVTHLLVRDYTGPIVEKDSDQWGDSAVDLDANDDGVVDANLPWSEIVDGVGFIRYPNETRSPEQDPDYSVSLGVPGVGPDRVFAPGHLFRNGFTGDWEIGLYSLVGGNNVDTPSAMNSRAPVLNSFSPTVAPVDSTIQVLGVNFSEVSTIEIGGVTADFSIVSLNEMSVTVPDGAVQGPIYLETAYGATESGPELKPISGDRELVYLEDFETSLGDFLIISLTGELGWEASSFGGAGFAEMSGYDGDTDTENEDWLISPAISLETAADPQLTVTTAKAFDGPDLEVYISTSYNTGDVPNLSNWIPLTVPLSSGEENYQQLDSGPVDLADYSGETVHVAFRYTSTDQASAVWQVHEFYITDAYSPFGSWIEDPIFGDVYQLNEVWFYDDQIGPYYKGGENWFFIPK